MRELDPIRTFAAYVRACGQQLDRSLRIVDDPSLAKRRGDEQLGAARRRMLRPKWNMEARRSWWQSN